MHHQVASLLVDARQNFAGYPMLESSGTLQLGRRNKGIEPGLRNEGSLCLVVGIGVANRDGGFVYRFNMLHYRIVTIDVSQRIAHILGAEHHFAVFIGKGVYSTELLVLKYLNFIYKILNIKLLIKNSRNRLCSDYESKSIAN